jgi:phytoene dehydrogenase-like protein
VFAGILHGFGLPVVAGGAGRFVAAFRALLGSLGVRVETGLRGRPHPRGARPCGRHGGCGPSGAPRRTRLGDAGRALWHILPEGAIDSALPAGAARFRHGRAAMQIHVALSEPLRWRDPRLTEIPLIHLSDGTAGTGIGRAEAEADSCPRHPTVVA